MELSCLVVCGEIKLCNQDGEQSKEVIVNFSLSLSGIKLFSSSSSRKWSVFKCTECTLASPFNQSYKFGAREKRLLKTASATEYPVRARKVEEKRRKLNAHGSTPTITIRTEFDSIRQQMKLIFPRRDGAFSFSPDASSFHPPCTHAA